MQTMSSVVAEKNFKVSVECLEMFYYNTPREVISSFQTR